MMQQIEVTLPPLHPGQRMVADDPARFKVLACGRRWGKTRLGVVLCLATALRGGRAWWVAPSYKMANVGWRGATALARQITGSTIRTGDRCIAVPSGGEVRIRSADDPYTLRGEGLDYVVLDECAYIKSEAWFESLRPALSDRRGGALFISTPHGLNWFHDLWKQAADGLLDGWRAWRFATADNPYIATEEIEAARSTLLGRIFRQEYEADFLEDNPAALWRREWIEAGRVVGMPPLQRIVVAVDPSATSGGDACGIVAAGVSADGEFYVLEDATVQGSPTSWARAAIALYNKLRADALVAEANQGGEMVTLTLATVDASVPVKLVSATRGKSVRAEPVAALYEQGRVHHVGELASLEDELCQWQPGSAASPNRLDALVWAISELNRPRGVIVASPSRRLAERRREAWQMG